MMDALAETLWEAQRSGQAPDEVRYLDRVRRRLEVLEQNLKTLDPFKDRINVFSGLRVMLDGNPMQPHLTGPQVCLGGGIIDLAA